MKYTKYLCISALALDTKPDACSALSGTQCGIYELRPVSCRSVPFHYSRVEALAGADVDAFVAAPGYRCDTSESANIVLKDSRIVCPEISAARAKAIALARADRPWAQAITKRLGADSVTDPGLPTLEQIDANSAFAATTSSMRVAWQIAVDIGLITPVGCDRLVERQLGAIEQALGSGGCSRDARETLIDMKMEYRHHLDAQRGPGHRSA